jgi:hypothetical protein
LLKSLVTEVKVLVVDPIQDRQKKEKRYSTKFLKQEETKGFFRFAPIALLHLRFEYINPMAGLAMFIIGLFLIVFGYFEYGITPVIVGLVLIAYYRKYLWQILGISQAS